MCVHNNNSEHRYSSQTPENMHVCTQQQQWTPLELSNPWKHACVYTTTTVNTATALKPLKTCMCVHNNNSEHRYSSQTPENMHVCTQQQQWTPLQLSNPWKHACVHNNNSEHRYSSQTPENMHVCTQQQQWTPLQLSNPWKHACVYTTTSVNTATALKPWKHACVHNNNSEHRYSSQTLKTCMCTQQQQWAPLQLPNPWKHACVYTTTSVNTATALKPWKHACVHNNNSEHRYSSQTPENMHVYTTTSVNTATALKPLKTCMCVHNNNSEHRYSYQTPENMHVCTQQQQWTPLQLSNPWKHACVYTTTSVNTATALKPLKTCMCVHNNNSEHRYSSQTPENMHVCTQQQQWTPLQLSNPWKHACVYTTTTVSTATALKPLKTCMCVHNNNSEHRYSSQTPENMHVCTQQQQWTPLQLSNPWKHACVYTTTSVNTATALKPLKTCMCVHNNNSEHRYSSQTPENMHVYTTTSVNTATALKPLKTCMCVHNNNSEHRYSYQTPENMHVCTQQQQNALLFKSSVDLKDISLSCICLLFIYILIWSNIKIKIE